MCSCLVAAAASLLRLAGPISESASGLLHAGGKARQAPLKRCTERAHTVNKKGADLLMI